jgi:hypothetical protein
MCAVIFLFKKYIYADAHILISVAVGAIFFFLFTYLLRTINPAEFQLFKTVLSKKGLMNTKSE